MQAKRKSTYQSIVNLRIIWCMYFYVIKLLFLWAINSEIRILEMNILLLLTAEWSGFVSSAFSYEDSVGASIFCIGALGNGILSLTFCPNIDKIWLRTHQKKQGKNPKMSPKLHHCIVSTYGGSITAEQRKRR